MNNYEIIVIENNKLNENFENIKNNIFSNDTDFELSKISNQKFYVNIFNNSEAITVPKIKNMELENIRRDFNEDLINHNLKIRKLRLDEILKKIRKMSQI